MQQSTMTPCYGPVRERTPSALFLVAIMIVGIVMTAVPLIGEAGEVIQRTVRGTVVAINVEANPQVIVVKVLLPTKEEMIVGARVSADTKITKGKQVAQLADLKAGQTAEITYLKTAEGLSAQSIHAH